VIPLDGFHASRSLRRRVRSGKFTITTNRDFEAVIRACAEPRKQERETWIDERIVRAYCALHRAGHAHSIEAWLGEPQAGPLVGGLYGVHIGAAFFAESKFSRPALGGTDASKVCLVHLVHHLRRRGFELLDVQFTNPHIEQFGVVEVPRDKYLLELGRAVAHRAEWLPFEPDQRPGTPL
jgi:leucyl/phenylalanyl-tRNA--protein transferase